MIKQPGSGSAAVVQAANSLLPTATPISAFGRTFTPTPLNSPVDTSTPPDTATVTPPSTSATNTPSGPDLSRLDTSTAQYTATGDGHTALDLYNSPIGYPYGGKWGLRDPHVRPSTRAGFYTAVHLPFDVQIASTISMTDLATLTIGKVTLGLGLAGIQGRAPVPTIGDVSSDRVTYRAPVASHPSDLSLQPTISGLNLHFTIHSAAEANQFTLSLFLDSQTHLAREPNGSLRVFLPIRIYDATGLPRIAIDAPEYIIALPQLTDSTTALPH